MKRPLADIRSWGPNTWKALHTITMAYPREPTQKEKEQFKAFFTSIQNVLPCPQCRLHYRQHLTSFPLSDAVLSSTRSLFNWLVDVHNAVNAQNNKALYTYEQAWTEQTQWHGRPNWHYGLAVVIILFVLFKCLKGKQLWS